MRYTRIFAAVLALLSMTSCAIDNLECPTPGVNSSGYVTVIGRVTRYDDYDVNTRGPKDGNEVEITSFAMAIFEVNGTEGNYSIGDCVHYEFHEGQSQLLFTLDRNDENGASRYALNKPHAIYVFANMPGLEAYDGTKPSLDELLSESIDVNDLDRPENGFPMIGSLGDTFTTSIDMNDKVFILCPKDSDGNLLKPTIGGEETSTLNIPLKALYAKMNFTIEVRPDQVIEGFMPKFELQSYTLNKVPAIVDFKKSVNSHDAPTANVVTVCEPIEVTKVATASGANKIEFSFYLPENLLTALPWEEYEYPFGKGDNIRTEDEKYRQRYKVKLLDYDGEGSGLNRPATNIVLKGIFSDHQTHEVEVEYTIYLGKDNFSDFNIVRNGEYNNEIIIRGILNSKDNDDGYISLDHRVNVKHKDPVIVSLRREVLLDSHFEIRPLRLKRNEALYNTPGIQNLPNAVKVEVVNPNTTNWMRIERSAGVGTSYEGKMNGTGQGRESIYITDEGPAKGKRRYFTHNLITGTNAGTYDYPLNNSTQVVVPIDNADDCVWIYVDECLEAGDGFRSGVIRLTYGNLRGTNFTPINNQDYPQVDYTINQHKLFKDTYDTNKNDNVLEGRDYYIEYEEEYLHNFDSQESFGETDFEGMVWGLDGQQFSYQDDAVKISGTLWDELVDFIVKLGINPKYDFYNSAAEAPDDDIAHPYNGYEFCKKIIQVVNGGVSQIRNTDASDNIDKLPLNKEPRSAVEYCYNKNKRNAQGQVAWTGNSDNLVWYLPAIDEIEEIVMSDYVDFNGQIVPTYNCFLEFQSQFYWSSQPAYYVYDWRYSGFSNSNGQFYVDALNNARSTSVTYANGAYTSVSSGMNPAEKYHSWGS